MFRLNLGVKGKFGCRVSAYLGMRIITVVLTVNELRLRVCLEVITDLPLASKTELVDTMCAMFKLPSKESSETSASIKLPYTCVTHCQITNYSKRSVRHRESRGKLLFPVHSDTLYSDRRAFQYQVQICTGQY